MGWFNKPGEDSRRPAQAPVAPAQPTPPQTSAPDADSSTRASLASLVANRTQAPPAPYPEAPPEDPASVFLETMDIEGSLDGQGDVVLRGRVRGSINISGSLVVTQTGSVQADVCAREVINAGTVEGNVTASEKVRVQSTGLVKGDIDSPSIVIDDGGGVEGFVQMAPPGGDEADEFDDLPPRPEAAAPARAVRFASRQQPLRGQGAPLPAMPGASALVAAPGAWSGNGNGGAAADGDLTSGPHVEPPPVPPVGEAPSPARDPLAVFFEEGDGAGSAGSDAGPLHDDPFEVPGDGRRAPRSS